MFFYLLFEDNWQQPNNECIRIEFWRVCRNPAMIPMKRTAFGLDRWKPIELVRNYDPKNIYLYLYSICWRIFKYMIWTLTLPRYTPILWAIWMFEPAPTDARWRRSPLENDSTYTNLRQRRPCSYCSFFIVHSRPIAVVFLILCQLRFLKFHWICGCDLIRHSQMHRQLHCSPFVCTNSNCRIRSYYGRIKSTEK